MVSAYPALPIRFLVCSRSSSSARAKAIAVGLVGQCIPEKVSTAAMIGLGVCTLYIGISGSLCGENVLIIIAAVVLGVIAGKLLNIAGAINEMTCAGSLLIVMIGTNRMGISKFKVADCLPSWLPPLFITSWCFSEPTTDISIALAYKGSTRNKNIVKSL